MDSPRIMVVEDEGIIAQDIKNCLENLGYSVPEVVFTGRDAIQKAGEVRPDLVLMDIVLKGDLDGIETATEIKNQFNIPFVYLTAYEDDKTLGRAKLTEPLGYILKPFEERYLRSSIEMALYKHKMERKIKENERWLGTILKSVADAVIVSDADAKISFMNPKAEALTGWDLKDAVGKDLNDVIRFINEETRFPMENPAQKVLRENIILGRSNNTILVSTNGSEITIDHSASPIRDEKGNITGVVLVIHDISDKKVAQIALKESEKRYRDLFDFATDAIIVQSLNGDILSTNKEACKLLGYSRDELYARKFSDILSDKKINPNELADSLRVSNDYHIETTFKRKDEKLLYVEVSMRLIKLQDEEVIQIFARNISDKKRTEAEITILAQAVKNINECVSITDIDNNITFVNDAFCRLYGYTQNELIGKAPNIIRSQKNSPELYKEIHEKTLEGGWVGELLNRSRDGREFPIELTTSIIRNEKGEAVGFIGVAVDITERKTLENALRESEKEYRGLFENAHDAILIYRPDDEIILDVNQRACEIYGFKRNEFIGMSLQLLTKGNDKAKELIAGLKKAGDSVRIDSTHYKKDATRMFLEVNARLIDYKGQNAVVSVNRDITEKKKSVEALLLSEKRYQDLYDSAPDMYFIVTKEGIIKSVNKFGAEYLGYNREDLYGKELWLIVHPEDSAYVRTQVQSIFKNRLDKGELEFRKIKSDGKIIWVLERTRLIYNDKGEPVELFIICRDVTDRKISEMKVIESEKHYRQMFEKNKAVKFLVDPDSGMILDVNEAAADYYGYGKEYLEKMKFRDICVSTDSEIKDYLSGAKNEKTFYTILQHRLSSGEVRDVEIYSGPIIMQDKTVLFCVIHDITERKKAELAMIQSERKYRDLAKNAPICITKFSTKDLKYEFVNEKFVELIGYTLEEYNKLSKDEVRALGYPEDYPRVNAFFRDWRESGYKGNHRLTYRVYNKKGDVLWLENYLYADFDSSGNPTAVNQLLIDITENKIAEKAQLDSETKYRRFAENAPVCVTRFSPETFKYEFINEQFEKLIGYNLEEYNNLSGKEAFDLTHPDDRERVIAYFTEWKKKGYTGKNHLNYRIYNRKKGLLWIDNYFYADFNELGEAIAINQILIDVTERKKAELVIHENQEKYKKLSENAPIAVTRMLLKENAYDFVNDEFVRQSGYTKEEFNALPEEILKDMIHSDDQERIFRFYKEWTGTNYKGTQHLNYKIINRNKEVVWLDTFLYADFDNNGDAVAINQLCIDITEQQKTQIALGETQTRFQALIENSSDMITLMDRSAKITYASPSIIKIMGYSIEELKERLLYDFIHPEDMPKVKAYFGEVLNKKGNVLSAQYRHRHKNATWVWIECTANNLLDDQEMQSIIFNFRDISERKRSEQELMLQKSYFQQLFESSPEGIVMLDNNDRIVNVNKGFEKMFQYGANEISGKKINDLIVPENLSEQGNKMSEMVLKGEVIHKETTRTRKDGSRVDVSIVAYPITLGNDQIGIYGIYSDITERKEKDKALQTSEERYKAFVKQSTEGIWRIEILEPIPVNMPVEEQIKRFYRDSYLAESNDVFAQMYGYKEASEISGARLGDMLVETDPKNTEYLKNFIESGYRLNNAESIEHTKEGDIMYFMNNLVGIIENGHIVRVWGTQRDITESKKAQNELRKTQFRLATLLNNLPDVVLYETGGDTEFISENVINLLGYPANKFAENRNFFPKIMHPADHKKSNELIKDWQKKGRPGILTQQFRCRKADGTYIWIEDHMVNVAGDNGINHMGGVLINVNETKKSEEKLKQLADKLAESNKELEQFAYVASHDLQEPLRMVASYIQLLQRRYKNQLSTEADEFINYAVDGVVRMKALINDLLVYSRVNTQETEFEDVDLNEILQTVLTNLRASIEDNKANVKFEILPVVKANKLQMTQVFQNLISNAIKFHGETPPEVKVSVKQQPDEWLFSISDNGIGIDKEFADRIFIIFQRLHNQSEYQGTGIGLSICKKIIERLGGHIWVESEKGKGSSFNFTIPNNNGKSESLIN